MAVASISRMAISTFLSVGPQNPRMSSIFALTMER
ncbi:hypothetical protein GBAR_LOCUS18963 [Geodia barretti]|uniref:Uncharacterized protein n=1 Tax=Geodia barretti TaxID=519541 RepID=A0AA35X0L3_GEOBA|nr:hypothetical protein GBAR_LOCUS18963 [Geodia barretti]